ncbi:synaptotagmin-like protein 2 isoform X4 [Ovis aries]|uniref:synaptotagmin-like protein 2 isoform X4 n=1 Tax=Ovis aries TaxID=9940 RepID=UPI00295269CF|nr:synaptotagmin-like protein 2 isoform X4 [Ovis aries]
MQETLETWVRSLGQEDPLEKGMATHSGILAWRIPWMEEPAGLQSRGSQRVGHDLATQQQPPDFMDQKHLPEKVKDDQQLKNMSGQWFYEAKAKRHRDRIHGADIIRASMRKKRPQVADEQSKDRANRAKESWVNNVHKDAFLPPELTGVVEEPEDVAPASPSSSVVNPAPTMIDASQENTRKSAVSTAKQRKNPFNSSMLPEDHLSQQTKNEQSKNGKTGFFQTSKEGELSESKEESSILDNSSQKLEKPKQTVPGPENGSPVKAPVPKARKMIYKSQNLKQDDNQPFPRQRIDSLNTRGAPRGILKRNSSSSSTDSETVRFHHNFEPKSKIVSLGLTIHERISEKEHSLEDDSPSDSLEPLKHVRFSAVKDELPQSPGLVHGREVGEFRVLESDRLKNGTEDAELPDEVWNDPQPSQYTNGLPFQSSASSPSPSKNETSQPTTSGSFPINEHRSSKEVLTTRAQSTENSHTINEHKTSSSELSKNPADELSCTEPKSSQVPDCSSRDHQQGKPPLLQALRAKTSSHSGPYATEIRKTTDDSISKVLDWFNRSSHSDDSMASLQYPQEIQPKEKPDAKPQIAVALVTDDTSQEGNGLIALLPTKVELTPVGPDSVFQVEERMLPSGNCQDNNVHIKPRSINLSPQGKESPGMLQPFEIYSPNQESKTKDYSQSSKNTGKAVGVLLPANNCSYSIHKGSHAEDQVLCNIKDAGSLGEEEPKLRVYEKNTRKSEVNFDSSTIIQEPSLEAHVKAESESKGRDTSILKSSLEPENVESPLGAANGVSPWKKLEVQLPEAGEVPQNRVQREKYKRVSDRISFWESTKAAVHKEPPSPFSQERPSAKACQPVTSVDSLPMGPGKCNTQVTAKHVILDNDGQAAHVSSFYSSKKPKETRPQISGPSKNDPSADQSGTVSLFQNKTAEPVKRLPVTDSLHSEKDITFPPLHHPSNVGIEMHTSLEKDRSLIGEWNPNFKVMSLQERMNEPNTEQVYNHSQFENLRRFWDLGANPDRQDNIEKNTTTTSQKNSVLFNSQKHKGFSDVTSSGNCTHEREMLLSQKEIPAREETEELNSKGTLQVLPDDTTLPWRPPRKSTHQLPRYESPKENMGKNTECFVTPVFKEENDDSDQELKEIQESTVKASVSSKDYKDTLNDSLQKLLSEASSPVLQPSGGKVHAKQVFEPDVSENRTWPQETDFVDPEEEAKRPKEISNEHIDKTVAPPKAYLNTLTASLDKLLKEATGSPPSPLQTKCEPTTTGISSESEESSGDENRIEQSQNTSADEREKMASFPEGTETCGNSALSQEAQSGSEEEPSPVLKILERSAARKMPSKSLEDISSDSSNQAKVDNLPEELVRSAEDDQKADQEPDTNECIPGISTVSSQPDNQFSHPDKLKRMSKSVPAFLQDEVSGSVMSVYSGDFGNLEVKGSIQFAIDYVDSLKELHVFVAQCKDLAAADVKKQRSDPYVKTYLLPDKGKMGKKKTLVVKKTLNPVYNEILRYKIDKQTLKTQKLNVSVWHRDTFKRNSFLGEVELDLETWDWDNKQNKQLKWYPLKRKTAPVPLEAENRGEMKLALQYVPEPMPGKKLPTTGEVHIWVKECLDLPLLRGSHLNSFVKCTILPDTSRKSRQKTRAVGKTTNPVFNHTMVYDGFRPEDLTEACVELTVWDHYKLTNQFLGGLRIGFGTGKSYGTEVDWMDSTSEEVALWEKMVKSPNTWIEAILPLRMLLIAKISK